MNQREQIEKVLDDQVRPMLKAHGGDVKLIEVKDGVVFVNLLGACVGCPSADLSTKGFIEDTLKAATPEIQKVELEQNIDPEMVALARKILHSGGGR